MPATTRSKAKILALGTSLVDDIAFPQIDGSELKKILDSKYNSTHDRSYIIDCRSASEYAGGYIQGAENCSTFGFNDYYVDIRQATS
jgi:hypothetical protein